MQFLLNSLVSFLFSAIKTSDSSLYASITKTMHAVYIYSLNIKHKTQTQQKYLIYRYPDYHCTNSTVQRLCYISGWLMPMPGYIIQQPRYQHNVIRPIQETFGDNWDGAWRPTNVAALKRYWRHIMQTWSTWWKPTQRNLRPTTRECVHSVTCGHFRSWDKDDGRTIRSAIALKVICNGIWQN